MNLNQISKKAVHFIRILEKFHIVLFVQMIFSWFHSSNAYKTINFRVNKLKPNITANKVHISPFHNSFSQTFWTFPNSNRVQLYHSPTSQMKVSEAQTLHDVLIRDIFHYGNFLERVQIIRTHIHKCRDKNGISAKINTLGAPVCILIVQLEKSRVLIRLPRKRN